MFELLFCCAVGVRGCVNVLIALFIIISQNREHLFVSSCYNRIVKEFYIESVVPMEQNYYVNS